MLGKLGTKGLLVIVLALAAAWWAFDRFGSGGNDRSFKSSVLQADTNAINAFRIEPAPQKHAPTLLFQREQDHWTITVNGHTVEVDPVRMHDLFALLNDLRTLSVIGTLDEVKARYDLSDTLADKLVLDLGEGEHTVLVGRAVHGNDEGTAVFVPGDEKVYKVVGRLGEWVEMPPDFWLAKYLVTGDPANWDSLRFTFPTDTGYTMVNTNGEWSIEGAPCDSAKILPYLKSLAHASGQTLVPITDTVGAVRSFELRVVDRTRPEPLVVTVRAKPDHFVVVSSLNPSVAMPFDGQREVPRMFRPRGVFLKR